MPERVYIYTYGCQMNEHDSRRMREVLRQHGFEDAARPEDASLILLNTCSVRENPENKVYSQLGRLALLKQRNPALIIGVAGCVAQQNGEGILKRARFVDMVFGPDHYFGLPEMIEEVRQGKRVLKTEWAAPPADRVQEFIPEEWLEAGHVDGCRGSIAIMKGCDNFCSFCIVPFTRGREVSRGADSILREARALIAQGVSELWLLGQNVNSYRANGLGFHALLDRVSRLDGLKRLRFTSPHPKDWDNSLSDLMAARPVICKHLHMPFQAGSDRILELMNRRHTMASLMEKIAYLRRINPCVELTTDLIVGFPSETDEDFERTLEVLEQARFSQVFSFKYSPRPGTRAAAMPDDVPRQVKEERLQRVIEVQTRITEEQLGALVGSKQEVLIDSAHARQPGIMNGRTDGYRPVSVRGENLRAGDLVAVRITGWRNHWLEAELTAPAAARG